MTTVTHLTWLDWAVVAGYLALAMGLGSWFVRREQSSRDYFRAGGRVPWWAAGLSLYGTNLSTLTYIAIPALVMKTNWSYLLGLFGAICAVPVVVRFFLPFYRRLDLTTAYEYLERRFHRSVRWLGSAIFMVFYLGRTAILLVLPALVLAEATDLTIYSSILLMGLFSVIYTMLGGIEAVVWTDVMQVLVLIGGASVAATISILSLDGGLAQFFDVAQAHNKFTVLNPGWGVTEAAAWVIFLGYGMSEFNAYVSDQTRVQRYLTTRDEKSAGQALWFSVLTALPLQLLFYTLGTAIFVFYATHPEMKPEVQTSDAIVPVFLLQQLPIGLSGLVVAGIFAAGMSTLDSAMNAIAATVVTDFYQPLAGRVSEARRVRLARLVTLAVGAIATAGALWVAAMEFRLLVNAFLDWLGLILGVLGGLFALGVFTRRAHWIGALVGLAVAAATVVTVKLATPIHFFLYSLVGAGTCFAVGYVASFKRFKPIETDLSRS
jgi:SSS family transporter